MRSGNQTAAVELDTYAKNLKQPDWPYPDDEGETDRRLTTSDTKPIA